MKVEQIVNYEANKREAEQIINHILHHADLFEYRNRIKPTVFMSNDVLAKIAVYAREAVTYRIDKDFPHAEAIAVCGYDVNLTFGKNVLHIGYRILELR